MAGWLLAGCGSSGGSAGGVPSGVRVLMTRWATAGTGAAQCDLLSSGFRFFIGNGDPSRSACVRHAAKVLGTPAPGQLVIHRVHSDHGQTLVDATVGRHRTTYYLVREYGGWRINSIGIREGLGPSPPPASVMNS